MKNTGTLIGAPIRPNDSADQYPAALQSEIKGGHHSRPTVADRDNIGAWLREAGMTCFVVSNGNTYELAANLVTWTLVKSANGGTTLPGTGGNSDTVTLISGNFGPWTPLASYHAKIVNQLQVCFKSDLAAFPSRAITYLQGQFSLDATFAGLTITLGTLPLNSRPSAQVKKYMITANIELFLVIETTGEVRLLSKDGLNLPTGNATGPYYIDAFFNPVIVTAEPETFTATRSANFTRNDCGSGYAGTVVAFTKTYESTIDQATADALSATDPYFDSEGQANANTDGFCSISAGTLQIVNQYGKVLKVTRGSSFYYISTNENRRFSTAALYSILVNIGIDGATENYWLYDVVSYDPNNPATYYHGTLTSGITEDMVIQLGQVLFVGPYKPAAVSVPL